VTRRSQLEIALLVDHPDRDLPGLVLTATELCRRGLVCHLVPANLAWREIWALAPDLVVFNYFRRSNQRLGRGLAEAGIRFVALDTEGGVWPELASYTELLWDDPQLRRLATGVYCWGPRMADHLAAGQFFSPEQLRVTGCPRFDFYHPAWRQAIAAAAHNGAAAKVAARAPRILLNTNFSTRNPRFATVEQKIETSQRNFGWSRARIDEILEIEERAITEFIDLAGRLATEHPGAEVLVRPHPFEGLEWYRRSLDRYPNVRVDNAGPVQPVLFEASVVIQRSCTTGIEAALAGVPTLSPQWVTPPFLMPVAEAVSLPSADYAQLAEQTGLILAGRYVPTPALQASIDTVIADWFHRVDGRAYQRVADAIVAGLPAASADTRALARRRLYLHDDTGAPLHGSSAVGGRVRLTMGLSPDWSFRRGRTVGRAGWQHSAKFYDAPAVQRLADRCLAVLRERGGAAGRLLAEPAGSRTTSLVPDFGYAVTLRSAS
jgi:surface carbohydrate biosynthesis protein